NNYFEKLINYNPGLFLKSNDFNNIEKPTFMSLLENDYLELKEIFTWDCVIQWGIEQIENSEEKIISMWNENDYKELKNILKDIIPLIRFQDISNEDFFDKIKPYQKLFP